LHDALDSRYNGFYEIQQERVQFEKCEKGYILDSEGPRNVKAFSPYEIEARGGAAWSELV
jgi:N-acetylglucosamine-6-sulfatase